MFNNILKNTIIALFITIILPIYLFTTAMVNKEAEFIDSTDYDITSIFNNFETEDDTDIDIESFEKSVIFNNFN